MSPLPFPAQDTAVNACADQRTPVVLESAVVLAAAVRSAADTLLLPLQIQWSHRAQRIRHPATTAIESSMRESQ